MKNIIRILSKARRRNLLVVLGIIVVLVVAAIAVAMASDNYDMPWTTGAGDNSGGGQRTSDNYDLMDVIGQTAPGSASSTNYHITGGFLSIMPIDTVKVYVDMQGANRPSPQGWEVPLNVGFYPPGSSNAVLLNPGSAIYYFPGTATAELISGGTKATVTVGPVKSGTYDITADSSTTLLNVKKGVHID